MLEAIHHIHLVVCRWCILLLEAIADDLYLYRTQYLPYGHDLLFTSASTPNHHPLSSRQTNENTVCVLISHCHLVIYPRAV